MGKPRKWGDLEVGYDPDHEEWEWRVQRVGWVLMAMAAIAAVAGLLGPGPLSDQEEGKVGSPLHVKYKKFARYQAPCELKIYCRPEGKEQFRLELDRAFVEHAEIHEISPEPEETVLEGQEYGYVFKREGEGEQLVTFRFESQQFGKSKCKITLDNKESVEVRQFYWP